MDRNRYAGLVDDGALRQLFAVALVVLAGVGVGALIALGPERASPYLGITLAAIAVGAGLAGLADLWRRR